MMNKTLHILYILVALCTTANAQDPGTPKVQIFGNVYGGGELAQVVTPESSLNDVLVTDDKLNDGPSGLFNPGAKHQYTTYVHLGSDAEVYGQSFGGGKGDNDAAGETLGRVIGQTDLVLDGATVWSELYGGGQMADVRGNTLLHFKKGKAGHNAFGGGLGVLTETKEGGKVLPDNRQTVLASADVRKIPAYDAGRVGDKGIEGYTTDRSTVTGNTFVVFDGSEDSYTHYEYMEERKIHYGGDGKVAQNSEGNYFDATHQYDEEKPGQYFSINHNIYGGGMTASNVEGNTYVHIRYGMVNEEMLTWTGYGHVVEPAWTKVFKSIANAQFCVFGGGYGYHSEIMNDTHVTMDVAGDGTFKYIEEFTQWFAGPGKEKYHWDTNIGAPEKIYAAADEATWSHGAPGRSAMDIVGGGYNGKVHGTTHVETSGDLVVRKVYGGGYYASVGNTEVTLKSGIYERVYGGGMIGNVYGKATLNFGQHGTFGSIPEENLHLLVKDAVYGGNDVSGTVGTSDAVSHTNTAGVTYNVYNPVDADNKGVRLNIYGGLVLGDVYGAGNGNHPGYGNPDYMEFNLSQHPSENYRQLAHPGTRGTDLVYKYRPRTGRVVMNIEGNDGVDFNDEPLVDKVRIWGRTFGGGNSCNVGVWDGTADDNTEEYTESGWHPGDNFQGGGTIQINIGSHVQLGNRNDSHETPNGLFMGSNGEHMITQHTDKEKARYYHQYWDSKAGKYYPGFVVYEEDAKTPIKRTTGLKAFKAFINNILTKSDEVHLDIDNDAEDVWMSNFVGGGYRGSMQAATATGKFDYTLPQGVTIGHSVVGGAFNAHIIYRVYDTDYETGVYTTDIDGNYLYQTVEPPGHPVISKAEAEAAGQTDYDYIKKLYAEGHEGDEAFKTGYLRYNFDGGMLAHDSQMNATSTGSRIHKVHPNPYEVGITDQERADRFSTADFTAPTNGFMANKDKALVHLTLNNRLQPAVYEADPVAGTELNVHGGIVYGGCFHTGFIEGDTWVDYDCSLSPLCTDPRFFSKRNTAIYDEVANLTRNNALNIFGAGYGADTHSMGDVYLCIKANGTVTGDENGNWPFIYNAFGGGNMGTVAGSTNVYYDGGKQGTMLGSLYGGGYKGDINGNTFVELVQGFLVNVYGGSRQANIKGAAHVWAYDGSTRPGTGLTNETFNHLIICNMYGGNDISGTISGTMPVTWTKNIWTDMKRDAFNTYVQVAGTYPGTKGFPLLGNVYGGSNGDYDYASHLNTEGKETNPYAGLTVPDIENSLLEIGGGTTLRAFGGGNHATITNDAYIFVNAPVNTFANVSFTDYKKAILMHKLFKGVLSGYKWDGDQLVMDPYHVGRLYGGNTLATMSIQPTWNLKQGLLENVYSGGDLGDMTYYNAEGKPATRDGSISTTTIGVENNADGTNANYTPRGLSITVNSPDINIKNLFGGCRLSNVVPGGYATDPETKKQVLAKRSAFDACENLFGATINILQGNIENVYGGNDVGGKVYFGTNINISGGVLGNVYGSGNGDYLYRFDPEAKDVTERIDDELGFYYDVPEKMGETLIEMAGTVGSDTHKILTINRIRPSVDKTFINVGGLDAAHNSGTKRVAAVKGNIFMGGNATTITRDGTYTFGKFKLGSYSTINGLFLGSDGHSYTQNEFIEQFAKLNGIKDMSAETDFESGHELDKQHNPILLNAYMMAVDVQSPPKDFSIKAPLTEAYLGTFCGGGNRGSMLHDKTVELDFPADLVIYDKIVAGCMNATVNYNQDGTNVQSIGGYVRGLDIANNNGNGNTKIRYTINSKFKPLVMDAEFDKETGLNKHNDNLATAMARGFVYEHLNAASDGWLTGCNIYGGCYQSGEIVGDVILNVNSNMLEVPLTDDAHEAKLKKSIANGETCFNVFGAGFGQDSHIWGNVHIKMDGTNPSANNIFGGGRNGQLIGNTLIEVRNGRIYSDVVGGSYASHMYGSSQIIVGYPTYYKCNTSGEYQLQRGDQWNTTQQVIKRSVKYLKGELVPKNVYEQITDGSKSTKFDLVNDAPANWANVNIKIGEGVYGGGYSLANSTSASAGTVTTHKLQAAPAAPAVLQTLYPLNFDGRYGLEAELNTVGYGGNSSIMVGDVACAGTGDHITISTPVGENGEGGIYGDGHLTFCEAFRAADIKGYGYNTTSPSAPRLLNTFQRLDLLDVTDCCLKLDGAQDFATNQIDATVYSLTRIDELRMNSSLDAAGALTPLSNTNGSAAAGFSTSKVRNYIGFNNNVHYLGAIVTNDKFDDSQHTFRKADGTMGTKSYKAEKALYISAYSSSAKDGAATTEFKKRNVGTARNCIGLNSGYCLRVLNLGDNEKTYYGPIVGVAEVKLLSLQQGEGGGYVYADNIHADENNFLNTSGNFVFPGAVGQGKDVHGNDIADQYIVDDCFMDKFGTPTNITTKTPAGKTLDEAHYWYVEGNKYFYNTTLTGYTFQDATDFNLIENDPNVILSGMEKGSKLDIKKIEWLSTHRQDYACVLETHDTEEDGNGNTIDKISDYEFDIEIGGTGAGAWKNDMTRYTAGDNDTPANYYTAGKLDAEKTFGEITIPQFNIKLQDKLDNSGDDNYINHLDEPEKVKIYLVGTDANHNEYEYTITLNIIYLQGPTYEGGVTIENCALPGERIGFSSGGIKIKTPNLMPITTSSWQILPLKEIDEHGVWKWDNEHGITIPSAQYNEDTEGGVKGWIPALYKQNEYNIAYIFTAGGHPFPIMPKQDAPLKQNRMIVVHNYHRMKDVYVTDGGGNVVRNLQIETMPQVPNKSTGAETVYHPDFAEAKLYIEDEADLRAFVNYLNMATHDNANHIPEGLAGLDIILQNDITLTQALPAINVSFAGNFHGDGYHIDLASFGTSLFGGQLSGQVYNLGLINGTISTINTKDASGIVNGDHTVNSYEYTTATDVFKYGKNAYDLSHHFVEHGVGADYVEEYYANGDYQYASTDRVWSLRTGTPNYGFTETRHETEHTHDAARWVDIYDDDAGNEDILCHSGHNVPLFDGTMTIADKLVAIGVGAEYITYHGLPAGYANDYLFFGQHLDKVSADPYPVHINPVANGDADATKGGNRVYGTKAYFNESDGKHDYFHFNADAWALQHINSGLIKSEEVLTSIDFSQRISYSYNDGTNDINCAETDNCPVNLVAFNVDSNADYDASGNDRGSAAYTNRGYKHVTQNLLVAHKDDEADKAVFAAGHYADKTPESAIRYHAFTKESDGGGNDIYTTQYFHLVDNQDFFAAIDKEHRITERAWYERLPMSYRNIPTGGYTAASVWEGICLPFTIGKVVASGNGEISHFYGTDELNHEYWLRGLTAVDASGDKPVAVFQRPGEFVETSQTAAAFDYTYKNRYFATLPYYDSTEKYGKHYDDASLAGVLYSGYLPLTYNIPYIIAFPGNDFYEFSMEGTDYDRSTHLKTGEAQLATFDGKKNASGHVTFMSSPTDGNMKTDAGDWKHVGVFSHKQAEGKAVLNNAKDGDNAIGTFFKNGDTAYPFRTYIQIPSGGGLPAPGIFLASGAQDELLPEEAQEESTTENLRVYTQGSLLVIESSYATDLRVYNIAGQFVRTLHVEVGINRYQGFHQGIYIVGNRKVAIHQ